VNLKGTAIAHSPTVVPSPPMQVVECQVLALDHVVIDEYDGKSTSEASNKTFYEIPAKSLCSL